MTGTACHTCTSALAAHCSIYCHHAAPEIARIGQPRHMAEEEVRAGNAPRCSGYVACVAGSDANASRLARNCARGSGRLPLLAASQAARPSMKHRPSFGRTSCPPAHAAAAHVAARAAAQTCALPAV